MKSKKGDRSILYKKWKEEHREEQERETLSQDIGIISPFPDILINYLPQILKQRLHYRFSQLCI